MQNLFEEHK